MYLMGCCYESLIGIPGVLERGHRGLIAVQGERLWWGEAGGSVPSAAPAAGPALTPVLMVH